MAATPTASHAYNLFSLTMESRFGRSWISTVDPQAVADLADEIVTGFGGHRTGMGDAEHVQWRFPDGSYALTGCFGLRCHDPEGSHDGERAA